MTQPYQPQYGQQTVPSSYIPPRPEYAPAPPPPAAGYGQYAPPMGGQALPTQAPTLGQSGRTGGATAPAPRHLVGRTVIFEPIRIDDTTTAKDNAGNMVSRPTAHYHLTVVDGGPLQYGDNRDHDVTKQHGMTFEVQTPCRFTNVSSDRFGIVNEVRDAIARGDMASVGVIVQGTQGNRPFLVTKPGRDLDGKDRPDGDQRFAAAADLWNKIFAKDLSWNPQPRSLVAPPSQAPQQVSYQPQPAQGPTYGTAGGAPQYVAPVPTQYATYQPAGAQQQYPTPGTAGGYDAPAPVQPAMDPGYAAYLAAQQAQQQPAPVPQPAPPVDPQYAAWLASQQAGPGI
jgi:hypothetical protein